MGSLGYRRAADLPNDWPSGLSLYENTRALPRAYVVTGSRIVRSSEEALATLVDRRFDPSTQVVLETGEPSSLTGSGRATIFSYEETEVRIRAESSSSGYLVLTDLDYPGWRAEIDGRPVPILRGNYMFRAVRLEPGTHEVVFRYRPSSFLRGGLISLATLIGVLLTLAWPSLRRFFPCRAGCEIPGQG